MRILQKQPCILKYKHASLNAALIPYKSKHMHVCRVEVFRLFSLLIINTVLFFKRGENEARES